MQSTRDWILKEQVVSTATIIEAQEKPMSNKTIQKYRLHIRSPQTIAMPKGAQVLKFGFQGVDSETQSLRLYVWVLADTSVTEMEDRVFGFFHTDETLHPLCDLPVSANEAATGGIMAAFAGLRAGRLEYRDTVIPNSTTEWHIFEGVNVELTNPNTVDAGEEAR